MPNSYRSAAIILIVAIVYVAGLVVLGVALRPPTHHWLFSEAGPFEWLSEVLWMALAGACLLCLRAQPGRAVLLSIAAILLGLREAGWHRAFTTDSLLKTDYYEMPGVPLLEKLPAALVAISVITLGVYLAYRAWVVLVRHGQWRHPWGLVLAATAVVLPVIKVVDRAPAKLQNTFGVTLPQTIDAIVASLEEGIEMVLPLLFLAALLMYRSAAHDAPNR